MDEKQIDIRALYPWCHIRHGWPWNRHGDESMSFDFRSGKCLLKKSVTRVGIFVDKIELNVGGPMFKTFSQNGYLVNIVI